MLKIEEMLEVQDVDEVQLGGLRCDEEQCGLKYKVAWGPDS